MLKCMFVMIVVFVSVDLRKVVNMFFSMNGVWMNWFDVFIRCMILIFLCLV